MEVMEEGNLMDRVPILLQRDLQYYQTHQSVLQEPICPGVVGGKLDFPRFASFAAIKMVLWWEDEYYASYRKYSGLLHTEKELDNHDPTSVTVKNSDPEKFVSLVTKSADLLLEHLHVLSQESLDHADLSVLTATIGASALIRNCLDIYLQVSTTKYCPPKGDEKGGALKLTLKQYSQMSEALAERLLDLHCRLLLLYIVQDADCLNWEDTEPFFESERGSYTVQMWWHYMRGTNDDLWNSVPPKMAQRIFAGMLNETLSILTIRYSQIVTSNARAQLHLVDITNLLFCVAELLPHICESGEAYVGLQLTNQSVIIRDIHAKCRELFYCLLLRGAPLGVLSKVFRKGLENMEMFSSRQGLPSAWIIFALPRFFPKDQSCQWVSDFSDLNTNTAISLELKVLLSFPEADWSFLVKVLLMRDANLTGIILRHLLKYLPASENFKNVAKHSFTEHGSEPQKCKAFLCRSECFNVSDLIGDDLDPVGQSNYQIVLSLTYILIAVGKALDIKACLVKVLEEIASSGWSDCLDKRQVWNQKRPPWLEAIMHFVYPVLDCVVDMLINAVEAGASMYQAMSLALTCVSEMWDCIPEGLYKITSLLQDIIPVSTKPLGDSVLLQSVFAALYTELIKSAESYEKEKNDAKSSICYSLSEAISLPTYLASLATDVSSANSLSSIFTLLATIASHSFTCNSTLVPPVSPKYTPPIEFVDEAALSPPDGYKDNGLKNTLGGVLSSHIFGAQHIQQLQVIQRLQQQRAVMFAARSTNQISSSSAVLTSHQSRNADNTSPPSNVAMGAIQKPQQHSPDANSQGICTECAECAECAAKQLQSTGWIVAGKAEECLAPSHKINNMLINHNHYENENLSQLVEKFWKIELNQIFLTEKEEECEKIFHESICRDTSGRFITKIPLKTTVSDLGGSYNASKQRLLSLERRLSRDRSTRDANNVFMDEYHSLSHMTIVEEADMDKIKYFAPHQYVLRPDSTSTKLRVVFDCSCKT
ncbi:uncharacterized protein LOC119673299 [Teleopsis dalmanni]|uniref:uncharacterized protein LOC119673299 n=1 Tax=Teleopsis dalmanni TaxID=139649 RepID=UPI0018CDBC22|nr:uncharacterized protein LOC119673299 [Teleopsis dalmanni]